MIYCLVGIFVVFLLIMIPGIIELIAEIRQENDKEWHHIHFKKLNK